MLTSRDKLVHFRILKLFSILSFSTHYSFFFDGDGVRDTPAHAGTVHLFMFSELLFATKVCQYFLVVDQVEKSDYFFFPDLLGPTFKVHRGYRKCWQDLDPPIDTCKRTGLKYGDSGVDPVDNYMNVRSHQSLNCFALPTPIGLSHSGIVLCIIIGSTYPDTASPCTVDSLLGKSSGWLRSTSVSDYEGCKYYEVHKLEVL